jgi:REP element-mobilizing transposase RayT
MPRQTLLKIESEAQLDESRLKSKSKTIEKYLDQGAGACFLARPEVGAVVAEALMRFEGVRYRLLAWCVMPNHVHAVLQPFEPFHLSSILHSWKSFSAQKINRILRKKGAFWQREYYDHLIRDGEELGRAIAYTAQNPEKAGFQEWKWVYVAKDWN